MTKNGKRSHLSIDFRTPSFEFRGTDEGPDLLVFSGVHGMEDASYQLALELVDMFDELQEEMRGRVTVVPATNLFSLVTGKRNNPIDGENLNGVSEEGREEQTISAEIADEIIRWARGRDYVINLHSGSTGFYVNHIIAKDKADFDLAREFGYEYVILRDGISKGSRGENGTNLISYIRKELGIPAFVPEVGAGQVIYGKSIAWGKRGIKRFVAKIGMLSGQYLEGEATPEDKVFHESDEEIVKAPTDGWLFFVKGLGKVFKKGEKVAYIVNPATVKRTWITAPVDGVLTYRRMKTKISRYEIGRATVIRMVPATDSRWLELQKQVRE